MWLIIKCGGMWALYRSSEGFAVMRSTVEEVQKEETMAGKPGRSNGLVERARYASES